MRVGGGANEVAVELIVSIYARPFMSFVVSVDGSKVSVGSVAFGAVKEVGTKFGSPREWSRGSLFLCLTI